MKARIIVNRQIVQKNRKEGTDNPPISVKTYRGSGRVHEVRFTGPAVLRRRDRSSLRVPLRRHGVDRDGVRGRRS